ncbi:TonB-dependent siderophore receptor [Niveispirillum sp. KHB5.9]|uniref:TonB-dependent siderophore receptor n=1 Tax=Niveispirillum sp. KHB5.9 TaxID=3400269 RepID=UPI003A85F07A
MKWKVAMMLGGAVAAYAMPASAQEAATAAADQIEEIVVIGTYTLPDKIDTATGLGLTVRETPQSVSIITAQRILDQNLVSISDVIDNAVGVTSEEVDDVRNQFYARGFEIRNYQVDGVPLAWTLAGGAGETIADVSIYERVEVVRGATGLLSGAGEPSASVNLVRKHADRKDWGGYASASYGRWNTWRTSADIGGAVTESGNVRVRGVVRYEEGESYIDLYENQKLVAYGTVDVDVTENTLLRAGFSHQRGKPDAPAWGALPTFYSDGTTTNWDRSKTASADWSYWNTTNQNLFASLKHDFSDRWSLVANYNRLRNAQQTELLYLSGTVSKANGDIQYSYPYKDDGESIQNSYDAQVKGLIPAFGRDHELVFGALHSVQQRDTTTFGALTFPPGTNYENWNGAAYPYPGFSTTGTLGVDERVEQTGYYGAVRLNLTDEFKLIGGGRLSSWEQKGVSFGVTSDYGDDDVFIPYVGALYDITPQHRVYASFTKIFQPQSSLDRNLNQLDPLDGKAYEIGLKSAYFDDALQTTLALFRTKQDNVATADIMVTPPGGGLPQQTYIAGKGTVSKGFEVEVTGKPVEGWNISLGYSQFEAEDANGNDVITDQPRKLLKLFTTYNFPGFEALTIGGGANYRSKAYSVGSNPVTGGAYRFQQDSYVLVSLMARYAVSEQLQLQANVENALDKTYYSQTGFYSQYRYGSPRNYTLSATYQF